MTTPSSHPLTEAELEQFIGTEHYYQSPLGIKYTDGIQYLAERDRAFWLIDATPYSSESNSSISPKKSDGSRGKDLIQGSISPKKAKVFDGRRRTAPNLRVCSRRAD